MFDVEPKEDSAASWVAYLMTLFCGGFRFNYTIRCT